ncbi:hypothetical protein WA026_005451, partial [Henosepilachna vigintioctopunctata]
FRLNYCFFGLQPFWYHVTNVILHSLVSVLFVRVALRIAGIRPPFATLAGLLFALHPIHSEAVTGIVGRADVLACAFFLVSLLAYHGNSTNEHFIWKSVVFGALSMMSKETGITVFLVNLTFDFYKNYSHIRRTTVEMRWNRETRQFASRAIRVLISLAVLLAVRLSLLQGSLPKFSQQDNPAAFHSSLYVRVLTFCYLAAFNWWLLLCPATLSHDWQMGSVPLITSIYDTRNVITCLFFILSLFLLMKSISDFDGQRHLPVTLGIALMVFPFLPATNIFVTVGFVVAERVLYIPSLGCILLVIYGLQMLWTVYSKHRQTILCFVILLLTTSCLRTIIRNRDWRSRESLLRAGLMTLPHNAKMHYNYANFLRDSARPELAKTHYHIALKLWPTYASAHNNLGTLVSNEQEAEEHFLAAIKYSADHLNAHYNLGQLYRKSNRTSKSEVMLKKCISIDPRFSQAYLELARLHEPGDMRVGKLLKQVMELNNRDPYYGTLYAHWLVQKGNTKAASKMYMAVLRRASSYQEAILKIFQILRRDGQKSRLFQIITRWQTILRRRRGDSNFNPHVYLKGWQLKKELNYKARVYENCTTNLFRAECLTTSSTPNDPDKWSHLRKHRTNNSVKISFPSRHCKPEESRIQKRQLTPLLVHHLLDSV